MDFKLSEEQILIQQSLKEFAQELSGLSVNESLKSMAEIDFLGLFFPEEVGGAGGDFTSYVLALEELSKVSVSTALAYAVHSTQVSYALYKWGTEAQKEKYLSPLCKGEKIGSFAYGEAWTGRDMLSIETTARKEGNVYVLNGLKTFVLSGGESDLYVVFAKSDEGVCAFVIEAGLPGLSFSEPYKKMGLDDLPATTMVLENVQVPVENLIGKEGEGEKIFHSVKELNNISLAAMGVGIASLALEKSISYGKERDQFNRPIIKFEALQEKIGKMVVNLNAAKLLTLQAAASMDNGEEYKAQSSIARYFALKTGEETCTDAIQLHGGYGYSKDLGVEVLLRDIKGLSLLDAQPKALVVNIARQHIG